MDHAKTSNCGMCQISNNVFYSVRYMDASRFSSSSWITLLLMCVCRKCSVWLVYPSPTSLYNTKKQNYLSYWITQLYVSLFLTSTCSFLLFCSSWCVNKQFFVDQHINKKNKSAVYKEKEEAIDWLCILGPM